MEIRTEWVVYNVEDSIECGYVVESEEDAREACKNDDSLTYGRRAC